LNALADDGRGFIEGLHKTGRRRINRAVRNTEKALKQPGETITAWVADGKSALAEARSETRKTIDMYTQSSKQVAEGIESDARLLKEDIVAGSRAAIEKINIFKAIQACLQEMLKELPGQFNLPSRQEVAHLNSSMDALIGQMQSVRKQMAV
jgi:hypothetical protein